MAKIKELLNKLNLFTPKVSENTDTSKESTTNLAHHLKLKGAGGWKSKFISDVYEERILYPHEEMEIAKKGFLYNGHIHAAVTSLAFFALGGELKVSAKNKMTETYLNDQLRATGLKYIAMQFMFPDLVTTGNFYNERIYSGKAIVAYSYIPDSDRMYIELDEKGLTLSYLQRLPDEQITGTHYKTIRYYGDRRKTIKGIPLAKNKVFHTRIGISSIPNYGRGPVCSIINDIEIILEVERAMAVVARYKSIPKKLLQLVKSNGPKDAQEIANALNNIGDDENPIISFEVKVDDMSYSGKELNFEPILNYLKKKLTVSLAPSYLIHGDETNYAVSKEQRVSLELKIEAMRAVAAEQLKKELRIMAKSQGKTISDFEIEFGTYDLGQNDEDRKAAIEAWNAGIITLDEAREMVSLDPDEENGEFYSFELKQNGTEEEQPTETETGENKNKKNIPR
jgi:hypothetical protein